MKQTAVEWLIGELQKTRDYQRVINEANQSGTSIRDVIKQAKEIELERLVNAYANGQADSLSLIKNMKDIPSDFNQIISDNFNDLV